MPARACSFQCWQWTRRRFARRRLPTGFKLLAPCPVGETGMCNRKGQSTAGTGAFSEPRGTGYSLKWVVGVPLSPSFLSCEGIEALGQDLRLGLREPERLSDRRSPCLWIFMVHLSGIGRRVFASWETKAPGPRAPDPERNTAGDHQGPRSFRRARRRRPATPPLVRVLPGIPSRLGRPVPQKQKRSGPQRLRLLPLGLTGA